MSNVLVLSVESSVLPNLTSGQQLIDAKVHVSWLVFTTSAGDNVALMQNHKR